MQSVLNQKLRCLLKVAWLFFTYGDLDFRRLLSNLLLTRQVNTTIVVIPAKAGIQANSGCRIRHPGLDPGPA